MKTYRLTWAETVTKISKPIRARSEEEAESIWLKQGCSGYKDVAAATIKIKEIENGRKEKENGRSPSKEEEEHQEKR